MNLLSFKFWFTMRPPMLLPIYLKALIFFIVVLGISIFVFSFLTKRKKSIYNRILRKLSNFCLGNVVIGLIILFFSYEMVPLLSSRFWFLIWGIEMAVWLFFIFRITREIPKKKEEMEKDKEFKKYIP